MGWGGWGGGAVGSKAYKLRSCVAEKDGCLESIEMQAVMGIDKATHVRDGQLREDGCTSVTVRADLLMETSSALPTPLPPPSTPSVRCYPGEQPLSSTIRLFLLLPCLSNPQPEDKREHSGAPQEQQRPFCQATE